MADLILEAERRIAQLEAELAELRNFISVADRLVGGDGGRTKGRPKLSASQASSAPSRYADAAGSSPREIVAGLFDILSEGKETLQRDELIRRLADRGVTVPGIYANKNLGTILWRNNQLFEHVQRIGYRWTGISIEESERLKLASK